MGRSGHCNAAEKMRLNNSLSIFFVRSTFHVSVLWKDAYQPATPSFRVEYRSILALKEMADCDENQMKRPFVLKSITRFLRFVEARLREGG